VATEPGLPRREVWLASGTHTQLDLLQRCRAQVSSIYYGVRRTARTNPPATPPPPVASAGVVQSRGRGGVDPEVVSPSSGPLLANSSLLATGPTTSSMVQSGGPGETGEVPFSSSSPLSQMVTAAPAVGACGATESEDLRGIVQGPAVGAAAATPFASPPLARDRSAVSIATADAVRQEGQGGHPSAGRRGVGLLEGWLHASLPTPDFWESMSGL
jgi:hypothetical protein